MEDPLRVKEEVMKLFHRRFQEVERRKFRLDGVYFETVSHEESEIGRDI